MKTIEMYEKPTAEFIDMQSTHALADTCWGNHGKGVTYTYVSVSNPSLTVTFEIKKGGCRFTTDSVILHSDVPAEIYEEFYSMGNSQPVKTPPFYPDSNPS